MNSLWTLLSIAVSSFVVALSGAMMPGPLLAVTWAEASRRGAAVGPKIVLGHGLLETALVVGVLFGLGRILQHAAAVTLLCLAGGTVLCWMGVDMIRMRSTEPSSTSTSSTSSLSAQKLHPVAAGAIISLANPYWTLWWATVGLAMMAGLAGGASGVVAFLIGHLAADLAWYALVAVTAARGRSWLRRDAQLHIIRLCGVVLIGFGLWFVWRGTHGLATLGTVSEPKIPPATGPRPDPGRGVGLKGP